MSKETGTAHSLVEPEKVSADKMSITEWIFTLGVFAGVVAFLGRGIIF